jgi:outer membrane receptor protein involved in Fe transport
MRGFPSVQFASLLSASALGLLITGSANAQQQTSTNAETRGDSLQEIVVTATKRESTVETTPISITAITGQELQDHGHRVDRTIGARGVHEDERRGPDRA